MLLCFDASCSYIRCCKSGSRPPVLYMLLIMRETLVPLAFVSQSASVCPKRPLWRFGKVQSGGPWLFILKDMAAKACFLAEFCSPPRSSTTTRTATTTTTTTTTITRSKVTSWHSRFCLRRQAPNALRQAQPDLSMQRRMLLSSETSWKWQW